jgi:hypothetical protein
VDAFRATVALSFISTNATSEICSSTPMTPGLTHWRKLPISAKRYGIVT